MELLERLLFGSDSLWGRGVAHSVMILALVIALGIMLGKVKVAGVSLGVTGILFVGIAFSYFGMNIDEHLMHFLKEFGLILFVYSIGLQVGPGFFSSFRKGGVTLNKLAVLVVALGVVTTVALYYVTGLPMTTMVGVMSGAVTNTPGLGAAQQAFSDLHAGADAPDIATGYALAYPLGVIGAILTLLALRYLLRIDVRQEEEAAGLGTDVLKDLTTRRISVEICNPAVEGKSISGIRRLALRDFVVSRICRPGEAPELADAATTLRCGDRILLVAAPKDAEALVALLGREVDAGPMMQDRKMISRRILITKPELNGKTLAELRIRSTSGVTITRINRSGIDLVAAGNLQLQLGDRVTVVGPELSVAYAEQFCGDTPVAVCLFQRTQYPLLILRVIAQGEADSRGRFRHGKFQMLFHDNTFLRLQYSTHNFLPKFPHVARPCVCQQRFTCFGTEPAHATLQLSVCHITEELCQRHDVFLTVTQRRNGYPEVVQAVQKILPKTLFIHRYFQIFIGSSDDADIEIPVCLVSDRAIPPLLYGAEQHLLGFQREVSYLVQKQRAAFRLMEISFLGIVRTCKCTFDVSEESRRCKLFGE